MFCILGFADQRRLKIVDAGGVGALVNMLEAASDDNTRREAAKALATLSACGMRTTLFSVVGNEAMSRWIIGPGARKKFLLTVLIVSA